MLFNTSVTPRDGLRAAPLVDAEHHGAANAATSFESVGSFTGPLLSISGGQAIRSTSTAKWSRAAISGHCA